MIVAALAAFGTLLLAWLVAPKEDGAWRIVNPGEADGAREPRVEAEAMVDGGARAEAEPMGEAA